MINKNEIICFSHDTKIQTVNGILPISKIEVGMSVLTYNKKIEVCQFKLVDTVAKSPHSLCVELLFENGIFLKQTIDHPIYVLEKGWCSFKPIMVLKNYNVIVSKLEDGDFCFYQSNRSIQYIKLVKSSIVTCNELFYCISAKNSNNFFANGILVHDENLKGICKTSKSNTFLELINE